MQIYHTAVQIPEAQKGCSKMWKRFSGGRMPSSLLLSLLQSVLSLLQGTQMLSAHRKCNCHFCKRLPCGKHKTLYNVLQDVWRNHGLPGNAFVLFGCLIFFVWFRQPVFVSHLLRIQQFHIFVHMYCIARSELLMSLSVPMLQGCWCRNYRHRKKTANGLRNTD